MDDHKKDHIYQEGPPQRNDPKQQQTHNVPTYDVENINTTNKGRYLLLVNKPAYCFLKKRKDAEKITEAPESYFT